MPNIGTKLFGSYTACLKLKIFKKYLKNIYLFLRERERERQSVNGGGAEREKETESEAGSRL